MKQASFAIDAIEGVTFQGWTLGESWNGFACPYFTKEQANKLLDAWRAIGWRADYNPQEDAYTFGVSQGGDGEESDTFPAMEIEGKKLYPIGNSCWIWEEVEDS